MSLVSDVIKKLAKDGEITHEFKVNGVSFVIRTLKGEEQFLADGMINSQRIKEKYGASDLMTLNDTIQKYRSLAMVGLSTKSVNGESPVDTGKSLQEQFKQRREFIEELMDLPSGMIDEINREYNKLIRKQQDFFEDVEGNVEKS